MATAEGVPSSDRSERQRVEDVGRDEPSAGPVSLMKDAIILTTLFILTLFFVGLSFFAGNFNIPSLIQKFSARSAANQASKVAAPLKQPDEQNRLLTSLRQASPSALAVLQGPNDTVLLMNKETSMSAQIAIGQSPSLSPDGSTLAYIKINEDQNIHLMDLKTGTQSALPAHAVGKVLWANMDRLVFDYPDTVEPPRPYGGGWGTGIETVSLTDSKSSILFKPTGLKDYTLEKIETGKIIFSRRTVKSSGDWVDPNLITTTRWQVNPDGLGLKQL